MRPAPSLAEKFAQQEKRKQMSVFLDKARQVSSPQMKTEGETSKDEKPPDPHPDPNTPRKKLAMSDIIIAAAAAKTVKLKSQGIDIF